MRAQLNISQVIDIAGSSLLVLYNRTDARKQCRLSLFHHPGMQRGNMLSANTAGFSGYGSAVDLFCQRLEITDAYEAENRRRRRDTGDLNLGRNGAQGRRPSASADDMTFPLYTKGILYERSN